MHKTYSVDFNEQKKLFIHAKILNEKFSLTEAPCIDSGSFLNLVPLRLLTGQIHNLKKADVSVSGIKNSPMPVSGVFQATVLVHNTRFKNVQFHVLDAEIPIIFGLKFLRHPEILNFTISRLNIHFEHITAVKSFSAYF